MLNQWDSKTWCRTPRRAKQQQFISIRNMPHHTYQCAKQHILGPSARTATQKWSKMAQPSFHKPNGNRARDAMRSVCAWYCFSVALFCCASGRRTPGWQNAWSTHKNFWSDNKTQHTCGKEKGCLLNAPINFWIRP